MLKALKVSETKLQCPPVVNAADFRRGGGNRTVAGVELLKALKVLGTKLHCPPVVNAADFGRGGKNRTRDLEGLTCKRRS